MVLMFSGVNFTEFSGMANRGDPGQTTSSGAVWSGSALFVYAILLGNFGVWNFRTFTVDAFLAILLYICFLTIFIIVLVAEWEKGHY